MNALAMGKARGFATTFVFVLATFAALLLPAYAAASVVAQAANAHVPGAAEVDATKLYVPTDLNTGWRIHGGDDPAWSNPNFDDSLWTPFDAKKNLKSYFPVERPSVVWYRLHVKVSPDETGLALRTYYLAHAYEIYVNGERLIADGRITPMVPYTINARVVSRIPERLLASGNLVIAARVYVSPSEWQQGGGLTAGNIALAGALPLGVVSGAEYERSEFQMAPGSRLTFYSDGVVEAQNARGELFGFERAKEISTQPAAAIVEAARRFGQQDDITVVTIAREATMATAA